MINNFYFRLFFWHGHHQCGCFFAALYLPKEAVENSFVAKVGVTLYKLLIKVPWIKKQLASSDFTFRTKKKGH
jgi:hypothetical protein